MSFAEKMRVKKADPARGSALCLLLSETFHKSFHIEKDRPYQWRLLHVLLGQHKKELSRQDVFDLMESAVGGKYYSLIDSMLKYLHHLGLVTLKKSNDITELPRSEENLKGIKLTGNFEVEIILEDELFNSVRTYVPLLIQHV